MNKKNRAAERSLKALMKKEKAYLDGIFSEIDPEIRLDEDQRRAVLTDEENCLVVAGAGAGKTTTIAAKIKYLVDRQNVDPRKILVISFTNFTVDELRKRLNDDLHIGCPVATFHSVGNALIHRHGADRRKIADGGKLQDTVKNFLLGKCRGRMADDLLLFISAYFYPPDNGAGPKGFSGFASMRSVLGDFERRLTDTRTKKTVVLRDEILKSKNEAAIAGFLYLNGIEYEYGPLYPYNICRAGRPYTPDFAVRQGGKTCFIEHFSIGEDGTSPELSDQELAAYKKAVNDTIMLHRAHGTKLICVYSAYNDRRSPLSHLKEQLSAAGFRGDPGAGKRIMEKLAANEENRYMQRLIPLICRFTEGFKVSGYRAGEFDRMQKNAPDPRTRLFLSICRECYLEYARVLKNENSVDFQDMINESADILSGMKERAETLDLKYIIVDEYQDISAQRFDLIRALRAVTDAKIVAVGDDWQSIYAFSGSDISLFTGFAQKAGRTALLKIERTYRNSRELIDIAGRFIMKNETQIRKDLISGKRLKTPVIIRTYDGRHRGRRGDKRTGADFALAREAEEALAEILEHEKKKGGARPLSVLLLGRFNFDAAGLAGSGLFEMTDGDGKMRSVRYPDLDLTFMTVHASKGLGYDYVVVVNGKNDTYGFPAKIEDDPLLSLVIKEDRSKEYAEERRLFYVALTRTKNRVYFIAPRQNPSEFLLEIARDNKNVAVKGGWDKNPPASPAGRTCPVCGHPLLYGYKPAYGLKLYMCTNDPEVCGYMSNDPAAGDLPVVKCRKCRDGFLIVRPGKKKGKYYLECTGRREDGTGCTGKMTEKQFRKEYR